ncbi:uncharacterized protein LOC128230243 isoform X2 [Mya arenaria]|nr:uncharacterized protein LOC128230243 isoform X2 [Mya arenaria]
MDPEPMEVEALNPPAPTYALRRGAGGTRAMQPRSLESGVEESEPMDTSPPIAAQNLPVQNVPDAQMIHDGQLGVTSVVQPQNEPRFGNTRAMVCLGITSDNTQQDDASFLEEIENKFVMVIKRDLFDGRLIRLSQTQMVNIVKIGKAKELAITNGAKVLATSKIPGFNTKVVIKELHIQKDDLDRMRYVTNEKLASRILHFGIVPLLAYHDALLSENSVRFGYYYFVSPYFENGDLLKAIEVDTNELFKSDPNPVVMMSQTRRLKIIYQVASAIEYLHTPVKDFRHAVLHMDIKSLNIVLDLEYNARLIDFGLAREMREPNDKLLITASPLAGTVGYFPTTTFKGLTKFHDYHNFGVVIRELLTGISPVERFPKDTLRTMSTFALKNLIQKKVWKNKTVREALPILAERCIGSLTQHAATSTFQISDMMKELKRLMQPLGAPKWTRYQEVKCEVCLVNQAADESEFLEHHKLCTTKIKVCASCMRNSFLNPMICHTCEKPLQPFIGENWGAILIAGNDKHQKVAKAFSNDVHRLRDVITSRSVPIMCIRAENTEVVTPDEPGKDDTKMWCKVQSAFENLSKLSLKTLIVVYSGHHGFHTKQENAKNKTQSIKPLKSVTGSSIEDLEGFFKLSENELLKDKELYNEIPKLSTVDTIFLFEDCCYGDAEIKAALKNKRVVKFNSSTTTTTSRVDLNKNESKYIGILIKALTATKETITELYEHPECDICENNANTLFTESFLTVYDLQAFIAKYIAHSKTGVPSFSAQTISGKDRILAYRYNFRVVVQFQINKPKGGEVEVEVSLSQFDNMQKLREYLFKKLLGYDDSTKYLVENEYTRYIVENEDKLAEYAAVVSIQVEHGPREVHRKEIDSLEQASSAWIARRDLIAQIRNVAKIDFQNYVADIVSSKDVEYIFNFVSTEAEQFCRMIETPELAKCIVDNNNFNRFFTTLEEFREDKQRNVLFAFNEIQRSALFAFNESLDHINTFLKSKPEDVSNVEVHIDLPKINAEKSWSLMFYHLERVASAQP